MAKIELDPHRLRQFELANLIGVSSRTIRRWSNQTPPPPKNSDGTYSVSAVVAWLIQSRGDGEDAYLAAMDPEDKARLLKAKADYEEIRRDRAQIDLDEKRGEMLHVEHIPGMLRGYLDALRNAGDILQREFGAEAARIINEAIDEGDRCLNQYADRVNAEACD